MRDRGGTGFCTRVVEENFSFVKRISYGLPAALMPAPKNIDGATGKVLSKLPVPEAPVAHNLTLTADGKIGLMGSKVLRYMTFSEMVRPLTMNHDGSLVARTR